MAELKCSSLLKDTGKEYSKISEAFEALRNGEITGEDFNKISFDILHNIDSMIDNYIEQ